MRSTGDRRLALEGRPDSHTLTIGGPTSSGLPGAFGCPGVGVPHAVAAAMHDPSRQVIVTTGDGAFGFNAMEIDTAIRHGAKIVVIVSNNAAWNIQRYDRR